MGTRGLTAVIKNNTPVVAQYGQWDHYPDGQGATIVKFLKSADMSKFSAQVDKCRYITDADSEQITKDHKDDWAQVYPQLSRDMGGEILGWIYNSELPEIILKNSWDFIKDSLFCEWAYIVNLDTNMFQICEGFQEEPTTDNPYGQEKDDSKYYPCKPLKEWPIDQIPDNWIQQVCPAEKEEE